MRRFTRKNSQNKTLEDLSHRKMHTDADEYFDSSSQSTNKNMSLDDLSIQRKLYQPKPSAFLIYSLLKTKMNQNLSLFFKKLKQNMQNREIRQKSLNKIVAKGNKTLNNLKMDGFNKIKQQKVRFNLKIKGLLKLHTFTQSINKKAKMVSFLRLTNLMNLILKQQNNHLKQIQIKYNENYLPQQFTKQFRKFLKINPKNSKIFNKSSQQSIQPFLQQLCSSFQSRRTRRNVLSDSQVVINMLRNYAVSLKDLNQKYNITQNQLKQTDMQRDEFVGQIKNLNKQNQNKVKDLKKLDGQLLLKTQNLIEFAFNVKSLQNLQRTLQYQIKICQSKGGSQNSYEFDSRVVTLKTAQTILKKLFVNLEVPQPMNVPSLSSPRSNRVITQTQIRKKSDVIQEQNSLDQSDIFQQINSITDQLLGSMKSETTIQSLKYCGNQKKFTASGFKNMHMPQLVKIHGKFQQILKLYCEKMFQCLQLQGQNVQLKQYFKVQNEKLSAEVAIKNSQLISLSEKISQLQEKMRALELSSLQSKLESQKNCQQLQDTIESLLSKLEKALQQIQDKNAQIQKINIKVKEKQKKIEMMQDEYRKFKKLFKTGNQQKKQRDKDIQQILQRSLSKSRSNASKDYHKMKNVMSPKNSVLNKGVSLANSVVSQPYSVKHNPLSSSSGKFAILKTKNMPIPQSPAHKLDLDLDLDLDLQPQSFNSTKKDETPNRQLNRNKNWQTNSSDGSKNIGLNSNVNNRNNRTPKRQSRIQNSGKANQLSKTIKNSELL